MQILTTHKSELILGIMIVIQTLSMVFPHVLPNGIAELSLFVGLMAFILCKLQEVDHSLKRKYN